MGTVVTESGQSLMKVRIQFLGILTLSLLLSFGNAQSSIWGPLPRTNVLSPRYLIGLAEHEKFIFQLILDHFEDLNYKDGAENIFHPKLFDQLRR